MEAKEKYLSGKIKFWYLKFKQRADYFNTPSIAANISTEDYFTAKDKTIVSTK